MSLTFDTATRKNTKEDPRMMAFFDALVQRDINGLSDDSDDCTRETSYTNLIFSPTRSTSSSDSSNEGLIERTTLITINLFDNYDDEPLKIK